MLFQLPSSTRDDEMIQAEVVFPSKNNQKHENSLKKKVLYEKNAQEEKLCRERREQIKEVMLNYHFQSTINAIS
jgi:hypothetical protein